jgi:hypothetical protein
MVWPRKWKKTRTGVFFLLGTKLIKGRDDIFRGEKKLENKLNFGEFGLSEVWRFFADVTKPGLPDGLFGKIWRALEWKMSL